MGKNREHSKFPNAITVLDNGNVGIGTSTPFNKLTVAEVSANGYGLLTYATNWAADTWTGIKIGAAADTGGAGVDIRSYSYYSSSSGTSMALFTNSTSNVMTERMRIVANGNIGIGTTSPQSYTNYKILHISGPATNGSSLLYLTNSDNSIVGMAMAEGSASRVTFGSQTNHPVTFVSNDTERMRIKTDGSINVGAQTDYSEFGNDSSGTYLEKMASSTEGRRRIRMQAGNSTSTAYAQIVVDGANSTVDFRTNTTIRMMVDSSGRVTKPNQPFFSAYNSSGASYTGDQTVIWGTALHNVGNCYNTSTGRFTAPIAGVYLFRADFRGSGVSGYVMDIATSTGLLTRHEEYASYANFYHQTLAAIYKLNAGDYVYVWARSGTIAPDANSLDRFEGYLLG